ncbi:MAG TPA: hypothetical protein VI911_08445 [Patescibacteria group bacterium]|nr:MAG: hypothetical protein A2417_14485 [Bdellovibrionales bacterium RIFOXYC1_FULL_37_79]OFZ57579.1 MAG: hypothetical protein A2381_18810 [Bdellovibrionales bacterium RIFOXYB1_FULL_37_110]OFZ66798.1 MAG: hypothetical protein A2328_06135 [Bdellovibrionales bacterium RIFOXYB2_FULL_36_6]HAB53102.1 hypothetical protein [Ignavibacteriales bacterium]HLD91025.1 hypothetical protein [Patescibacteria group bacterium]
MKNFLALFLFTTIIFSQAYAGGETDIGNGMRAYTSYNYGYTIHFSSLLNFKEIQDGIVEINDQDLVHDISQKSTLRIDPVDEDVQTNEQVLEYAKQKYPRRLWENSNGSIPNSYGIYSKEITTDGVHLIYFIVSNSLTLLEINIWAKDTNSANELIIPIVLTLVFEKPTGYDAYQFVKGSWFEWKEITNHIDDYGTSQSITYEKLEVVDVIPEGILFKWIFKYDYVSSPTIYKFLYNQVTKKSLWCDDGHEIITENVNNTGGCYLKNFLWWPYSNVSAIILRESIKVPAGLFGSYRISYPGEPIDNPNYSWYYSTPGPMKSILVKESFHYEFNDNSTMFGTTELYDYFLPSPI